MNSLYTTKLGSFNKDQDISTPDQITSYVDSIVSADNVAFGKNSIANLSSIAIGRDSTTRSAETGVAIGFKAESEDNSGVVIVGAEAKAKDYGTAVGLKAYSNLGVAFGADACALSGHSIALGRYACVSAQHAIQINGKDKVGGKYDKDSINDISGTMMFYNGRKNVTIVRQDGTISADNAYAATKLQTARKIGGTAFDGTADINLSATSATTAGTCTGNSATATKLQTARTIGGVSFDGTANISLPGVNTAGTQNTSGKANTAGTADQSDKIKAVGLMNAYVQLSVVNAVPSEEEVIDNTLYLVVES